MYGVSYDGLTAGLALLHPHPALKAISEQASPADQWMNDDDHRYRRAARELRVRVRRARAGRQEQEHAFRLRHLRRLRVVSGARAALEHQREISARLDSRLERYRRASRITTRSNKEAWFTQLHASTVPNSQRRRVLGSGRSVGAVADLPSRRRRTIPNHTNFMVAGPWYHGSGTRPKGDSIGHDSLSADTRRRASSARTSRRRSSATTCTARAKSRRGESTTFQSGSNRWRRTASGRRRQAKPTNLYLHADGTLSFDEPGAGRRPSGISRIRLRSREPRAVPAASDLADVSRRRLAHLGSRRPAVRRRTAGRADVHERAARSRPHRHRRSRPPTLFASTSGTDADFIVKLIDVYPENAQPNAWDAEAGPEPGEYARSLNGYELPIAMEVRRGRYLKSYEQPRAACGRTPRSSGRSRCATTITFSSKDTASWCRCNRRGSR